ncbi:DUF4926 domain-containing protein [Methylobacterium sp. A54F]
MSVEVVYLLRKDVARPDLDDLDDVRLTAAARTDEGADLPAGSEGTVVGVWRDEGLFIVEFAEPVAGLATVPGSILTRVGPSRGPSAGP